jgi:hypothetical protein
MKEIFREVESSMQRTVDNFRIELGQLRRDPVTYMATKTQPVTISNPLSINQNYNRGYG